MALKGKRLKNLVIKENSGVDAPAHLVPGWTIRKAAGDGEVDVDEFLSDLVKQLESEQEETPMKLTELLAKAKDNLDDDEKAKVDAFLKSLDDKADDEGTKPDEAATKALADAETARKAAEDRATKAEAALKALAGGTEPDTEAEELAKALSTLPEPVRKMIEANNAKVTEAETVAKQERDARLSREYLEKAKGLPGLVTKAEEFGTVLREVDEKLSKEASAELGRILKAASHAIENSEAFKELGGAGADATATGDAALKAKGEEIHKAAQTAGAPISMAEAIKRAGDLNPELLTGKGA